MNFDSRLLIEARTQRTIADAALGDLLATQRALASVSRLFRVAVLGFIALAIVAAWNRQVLRAQLRDATAPVTIEGCTPLPAGTAEYKVIPPVTADSLVHFRRRWYV